MFENEWNIDEIKYNNNILTKSCHSVVEVKEMVGQWGAEMMGEGLG